MIATEDNFFRLYRTHIEFVFNNNIDGKSHSEFLGSNNYINGKTNLLTKNNILQHHAVSIRSHHHPYTKTSTLRLLGPRTTPASSIYHIHSTKHKVIEYYT